MQNQELFRTTLAEANFLLVGVDIVTYAEHHTEEDSEWWFLYWQPKMSLVLAGDPICVSGEKEYLRGKVKGIHQTVNIEIPTWEAVLEIGKKYHQAGELVYASMVKELQTAVLFKLAGEK